MTVGDSSTVYQKPSKNIEDISLCAERERSAVGKIKNIMCTPAKGVKDTFEKELKSNAVGDTFVDPGQYFLRKPDNNDKLKKQAVKVG